MGKNSNNDIPYLNFEEAGNLLSARRTLLSAEQCNLCAERAYWWMRKIDKEAAERLGVMDKIKSVLSLLQKVDNLSLDIQITISQKLK